MSGNHSVTWQPQTYSFFLILAIDWRRYGIRNGIDSARKTALPEQAWETISASLKIMHPSIVNDACAWSERTLYRERPGTTPLFKENPMFDALISGAMIMGVFALSYGIVRVAWWIFNDETEE